MAAREMTIVLCQWKQAEAGRWFLAIDMNCDGVFTISDVFHWFEWVFFLPADGLLWALMEWQSVATFLEVTPAAYSGWFSGIVSAFIWLIAMVVPILPGLLWELWQEE